ncbi:unnamed protein product [Penicillium salamii]|nr:unnamed protein product [Penicillium salamii]CAG8332691.1 unnamed protein product [Penicillium salamii]
MAPTVAFITGANRGLGFAIAQKFAAKPNYVVVAAVRDPAHDSAQQLPQLPTGEGSRIIVVKYDASVEQSAFDAVKQATDQGVDHFDYVLANAGIAKVYPLAKDAKRADILEHFQVNVLSVLSLYQATRDLLQKSILSPPAFSIMGSGTGSLGNQPDIPNAVYGASKSSLLWYGVRINKEDEWLNTFIIDPGWVQTDMGNATAAAWGYGTAPTTVEESTSGIVDVITKATKEQHGGRVVLYNGEVQGW